MGKNNQDNFDEVRRLILPDINTCCEGTIKFTCYSPYQEVELSSPPSEFMLCLCVSEPINCAKCHVLGFVRSVIKRSNSFRVLTLRALTHPQYAPGERGRALMHEAPYGEKGPMEEESLKH